MKCKMAVTLLSCLKIDHWIEWFSLPDGPLEILASGTCLPDKPLKLKLTPTHISSIPPFLSPTSNGDRVHLGKMSLYGHTPVFSHSQSGSA